MREAIAALRYWTLDAMQIRARQLADMLVSARGPRQEDRHKFNPDEDGRCVSIISGADWTAMDPIRCRLPRERHLFL